MDMYRSLGLRVNWLMKLQAVNMRFCSGLYSRRHLTQTSIAAGFDSQEFIPCGVIFCTFHCTFLNTKQRDSVSDSYMRDKESLRSNESKLLMAVWNLLKVRLTNWIYLYKNNEYMIWTLWKTYCCVNNSSHHCKT